MKIAGCYVMVPSPWGPKIGGTLPNGSKVYFQARKKGGETNDRLTVTSVDDEPKHHWVDQIHAGFGHVTIKYAENGNKVWVESDGTIGASIDLATNDFRSEFNEKHDWAQIGTGTTPASGPTGSILWLVGPW